MTALAKLCSPNGIFIPFEGWPDDRVYYGPEGMVKLVEGFWENFESTAVEVDDVIEVSETRAVALMTQSGVQQGVTVQQRLGGLFDFDEEGLWVRVEYFLGHEPALEAAGIPHRS